MNDRGDFEWACIKHFLYLFIDLICYPLALIAAMLPWRTYTVIKVCHCRTRTFTCVFNQTVREIRITTPSLEVPNVVLQDLWQVDSQCTDSGSTDRWGVCWEQFFCSLADMVCVPLGLLALVLPWRLPYLLMDYYDNVEWDNNTNDWRYYHKLIL